MMTKMNRNFLTKFILVLVLILIAGCATVMLKQPINRTNKNWDITVTKITDGPNSYGCGAYCTVYANGGKFGWIYMTLKNLMPTEQSFDFKQCMLTFTVLQQADMAEPSHIDFSSSLIPGVASMNPELKSSENISRQLAYLIPEKAQITGVKCLNQEFRIP